MTSGAPGPVGTLQVALDHAARLLGQDPALPAEQATEILKSVPGHPVAMLILGSAQRASGNLPAAITTLEALARAEPKSAATLYELSLALAAAGRGEAAVTALRRALQLKPDLADGWRRLGDHLSAMGDAAGADAAYANHVKAATRDPRLLAPAAALTEGRIADAESLLREHLAGHPTDVAALRMLAEVSARLGRYTEAEQLLARCLELSPSFSAARHNYANVLQRLGRSEDALREVDGLLATDPRNSSLRSLKAAALARLGEYERSIALYESVLEDYPGQAKLWMSLGHAVKTTGRQQRCIEVYRRSIELEPSLGEAWWSLANLKTYRFGADDVAAMRAQVVRTDLADEDRLHFHFTLGKALEDAGEYAESFHHYAAGNALRRRTLNYDARTPAAPPLAFTRFHARSRFSRERICSNRSSEEAPCSSFNSRCAMTRPLGFIVSGKALAVEPPLTSSGLRGVASPLLCPRLTPAPARRPLLDAAPDPVSGTGPGGQISLSKDANSACATAPFTSGAEHRTLLCLASSSAPSALYGISVRRLTSLTSASFPRVLAVPQLPWSSAWAILPPVNGRPNDRVPAPGTSTPFVHAHVRRTQAAPVNAPVAPRVQFGHIWRRVTEQRRYE